MFFEVQWKFLGPRRLVAQDAALSRRQRRFESGRGYAAEPPGIRGFTAVVEASATSRAGWSLISPRSVFLARRRPSTLPHDQFGRDQVLSHPVQWLVPDFVQERFDTKPP